MSDGTPRQMFRLATAGFALATAGLTLVAAAATHFVLVVTGSDGADFAMLGFLALVALAGSVGILSSPRPAEQMSHPSPPTHRIVAWVAGIVAVAAVAPDLLRPGRLGALQLSFAIIGLAILVGARRVGAALTWFEGVVTRLSGRSVAKRDGGARGHQRVGSTGGTWSRLWLRHRGDALAVLALAVGGFLILLLTIREPLLSDDTNYFAGADALRSGDFHARSANLHRLGLVYSVAAAQQLFGFTETAYYAVPFVYNLGLVIAVYALGRLFFSRSVAFLGAAFLLIQPAFLEGATLLLPDWPATFWFVAGLALALVSVRAGPTSSKKRVVAAVSAGFAFFVAVWIKESIAPMMLIVPLGFWAVERHSTWRRLATATTATLVLLLGVELLINSFLLGNPLSRLQAILGGHVAGARNWVDSGLVSDSLSWWNLATRFFELMGGQRYGIPLLTAMAVSAIVLVIRPSRGSTLFGASALLGVGFVSLAVVSFDPLTPLLRTHMRYLAMGFVFIPTALIASAWSAIGVLWDRDDPPVMRAGAFTAGVVVSVLVITSGVSGLAHAIGDPRLVRNEGDALAIVRSTVLAVDAPGGPHLGTLYTDLRTSNGLRIFLPGRLWGHIRSMDYVEVSSEFTYRSTDRFAPGDTVIINHKRLEANELRFYGEPLPDWVDSPPTAWVRLANSSRPRMEVWYVLDEEAVEAAAADLTPLLVGFVEDLGEEVVPSTERQGWARFGVRDDQTLRVVLGTGGETTAPVEPELQLLSGGDTLVIEMKMWVDPSVRITRPRLIVSGEEGDALEYSFRRISRDGRFRVLAVATLFDPADSVAFRVAFEVEGEGYFDLAVTASILDLGLDELELE